MVVNVPARSTIRRLEDAGQLAEVPQTPLASLPSVQPVTRSRLQLQRSFSVQSSLQRRFTTLPSFSNLQLTCEASSSGTSDGCSASLGDEVGSSGDAGNGSSSKCSTGSDAAAAAAAAAAWPAATSQQAIAQAAISPFAAASFAVPETEPTAAGSGAGSSTVAVDQSQAAMGQHEPAGSTSGRKASDGDLSAASPCSTDDTSQPAAADDRDDAARSSSSGASSSSGSSGQLPAALGRSLTPMRPLSRLATGASAADFDMCPLCPLDDGHLPLSREEMISIASSKRVSQYSL